MDTPEKILIVEDDLDVAEMVTSFFLSQGYEVFTVNYGEDGVLSCQTNHPDLVILDIRLPDIDGYEVARRLRSERRTANVPIIFLTEKRERNDKLQGLELGADDYITKPFDIQELRLRVRNALMRMKQEALTNSITGLPEGPMVDEKLKETLTIEGMGLAIVSLENLDAFRELYGFVASDDVLRAFSVMLQSSITDVGAQGVFLGHINVSDFIAVIPANLVGPFQENIRERLAQSMVKFYPIKDYDQAVKSPNRLMAKIGDIPSVRGRFTNVDQLKAELLRVKR